MLASPRRPAHRGPLPLPSAVAAALLVPALLAAACGASAGDATRPTSAAAPAPAAAAPGTVLDSGPEREVAAPPPDSAPDDAPGAGSSGAESSGEGSSGAGSPGAESDAGSAAGSSAVPGPLQVTPFTFASRDTRGAPMSVTAVRVTSRVGWTGPGPRPLLVVAPGTSGMADRCAPSRAALRGRMTDAAVAEFARRGWTVVQTDYEGLGTPGTHTYMLRESQGHAVLDAARAGLALDDSGVGRPVAISGYSQGGGAAASAAELAPSYAPDLDLRGVVAGAVPADLAEVAGTIDGSALAGAVGYSITGLTAAYPELEPHVGGLLNKRGRRMLETVADQCVEETLARFAGHRTSEYSVDGRSLPEHLRDDPAIRAFADEQRIGRRVPAAPVFMAHNVADDIVPFAQGRRLGLDWCAAGADVRFTTVDRNAGPLLNHGVASRMTRDAQWAFLASAVSDGGPSTPSNCGAF